MVLGPARRIGTALLLVALAATGLVGVAAPAGADPSTAPAVNSLYASYSAGEGPQSVALGPDGTTLYVANFIGSTLSVIDTSGVDSTVTVALPARPGTVVMSPVLPELYVTLPEANSIVVVSTETNSIIGTVETMQYPFAMAIRDDGALLYVANSDSGTVSIIDPVTQEVVDTIYPGGLVTWLALSTDQSQLYVGADTFVSVIDLSTPDQAIVTDTSFVYQMALVPGTATIIWSDLAGVVRMLDLSTSESTTIFGEPLEGLGGSPCALAVSPDAATLYVGYCNGVLRVVDLATGTELPSLSTGQVISLAVSADSTRVFAANFDLVGTVDEFRYVALTAPEAPTDLVATPGDGSASITFTSGADGGAAITKYQFSTDGGSSWNDADAGTTSPVTISGLTNGTSYSIELRAVNSVGGGAASASVSVTPRTTPSAPTVLRATPGDGSVSISFTAGADGGAAITKYQFSTDGGSSWNDADAGTTSPVTISGLANYTSYSISLRAVNAAGPGTASSAVSAMPAFSAPILSTPTFGPGFRSIRVWWTLLEPDQVRGRIGMYRISLYLAGTDTRVRTCRGSAADITCEMKGLKASTAYEVRIHAVRLIGHGRARQSFVTLASPPRSISTP